MKFLAMLSFITATLFACTGDCMTCHPALIPTIHEDARHKPMLGCVKCHIPNPDSMSECGKDCFKCHTQDKIDRPNVREHDVIRNCRDCHTKMQEELFEIPLNPGQSHQQPLRDFLLQ